MKFNIKFLPTLQKLLTSKKYNFKAEPIITDGLDTIIQDFSNGKHKVTLHSNTYAEETYISGDIENLKKDLENIDSTKDVN